jgi:hypothetical protein
MATVGLGSYVEGVGEFTALLGASIQQWGMRQLEVPVASMFQSNGQLDDRLSPDRQVH